MANDRPTNLRMGFGFPQARAAGAPYVSPRSGYVMDWDVNERRYQKELAALIKLHPFAAALVREKMETMKKGEVWVHPGYCFQTTGSWRSSATLLYYFVAYDKPEFASKGYWRRTQEKYNWPVPPQSN